MLPTEQRSSIAQMGGLHDAVLEQVILHHRPGIERNVISDLHKVEFREQAGGDVAAATDPASQEPQQRRSERCAKHEATTGAMIDS